jgi:hypothetical protein
MKRLITAGLAMAVWLGATGGAKGAGGERPAKRTDVRAALATWDRKVAEEQLRVERWEREQEERLRKEKKVAPAAPLAEEEEERLFDDRGELSPASPARVWALLVDWDIA